MVITDFLERNARLYGSDIALVEVNPSEERDSAVTWREASLIAEAQPDAPYRRELYNHNRLLRTLEGATGGKTGFTKKA